MMSYCDLDPVIGFAYILLYSKKKDSRSTIDQESNSNLTVDKY